MGAAAVTLGYDQQTWCDGENQYIKEEAVQFINYDWEELPQNVKDAAHILGFNHEVWDNGGKTPHTDEYDGGRPKMTLNKKSPLHTRARNAFGADGTVLRIAFFVG